MKKSVLILLLFVAVAFGLWKVSSARGFQFFGRIVPRVETADSVVALTFDDGPTPAYTGEILSVLRDHGVKATFFVTGQETNKNLEAARRIVAEGHELGNHSYSHDRMILKGPGRIREEIEFTDRAIRKAGFQGDITFRPPYGKKLFVLPWYLSRTGRTTVTWDIEPESYPEVAKDADSIAAHVLKKVRPGSIVLLHLMYESRAESRKALPLVITGLQKRGYRLVTVSELLRRGGSQDASTSSETWPAARRSITSTTSGSET